jgi:small GTP-binding protein
LFRRRDITANVSAALLKMTTSCAPKLVLLGNSGVGKTAIGRRYVSDSYNTSQQSTIGAECLRKQVTQRGRVVDLAIWDTAGQEVFRALTPQYYRDASMALVVFSILDEDSFTGAEYWIKNVQEATPSAVIVLAGNMADLEGKRVVSMDSAFELAERRGIDYVETSALSGQGIATVFETAIEKYLDRAPSTSAVQVVDTPEKDSPQPPIELDKPGQTERRKCC